MQQNSLIAVLEQFGAQRRYRQLKRNEYLRRFEVVKQSLHLHSHSPHSHPRTEHPTHPFSGHIRPEPAQPLPAQLRPSAPSHVHNEHVHPHVHSHVHPQPHREDEGVSGVGVEPVAVPVNELSVEEESLLRENGELRTMEKLQADSGREIAVYRQAIEAAKNKYLGEMARLAEASRKSKQQIESKLVMLKEQTEAAVKKNEQIESVNAGIRGDLEGGASRQCIEDIRKEYDEKIGSFQAIFNSSNEKIEAMERDFNEEEFVSGTLENEELLKSITDNAERAGEAAKILEDYITLSKGKTEILSELESNIAMKEAEISKMGELEEKIKVIMEKLTAEKRAYLAENGRMGKELSEIKDLLMATMSESK